MAIIHQCYFGLSTEHNVLNGLNNSPQQLQLFKKDLLYLGNIIFIKGKKVCIKSMRMRIEAIKRLKPPTRHLKGTEVLQEFVNYFKSALS